MQPLLVVFLPQSTKIFTKVTRLYLKKITRAFRFIAKQYFAAI